MSEDEKKDPPEISWEFKKEFEINKRMKDLVKVAITATEAEIAGLRKKLEKLTYGS